MFKKFDSLYLFVAGIIHLDLKPSNFVYVKMLGPDAFPSDFDEYSEKRDQILKVIDFGYSEFCDTLSSKDAENEVKRRQAKTASLFKELFVHSRVPRGCRPSKEKADFDMNTCRAKRQSCSLFGTPNYMSPEQIQVCHNQIRAVGDDSVKRTLTPPSRWNLSSTTGESSTVGQSGETIEQPLLTDLYLTPKSDGELVNL